MSAPTPLDVLRQFADSDGLPYETVAAVAEMVEALRESDAALTLCRDRWPFQPSPAQMPAYKATMAAKARIAAALAKFGGAK